MLSNNISTTRENMTSFLHSLRIGKTQNLNNFLHIASRNNEILIKALALLEYTYSSQ